METILSKANRLLRSKNYREAIELYKQINNEKLISQGIVAFNLTLAEVQWTRSRGKKNNTAPDISTNTESTENFNAFDFVASSFKKWISKNPSNIGLKPPKVSAIMTCHNAQDTIQEAVESLLLQTYPNLEVIVCDDGSTDNSWEILQEIKKRCGGLRIIRNNGNYGTYLSKNRAIEKSTGEILVFQDSDDISHPKRIEIQASQLITNKEIIATRSQYLRYNDTDSKLIPVGGLLSKLGLITLAVRKQAFREIGFFDATRRAADDEWVQRLLHVYGKNSLLNLNVALYLARLRETSLISDMIQYSADGKKIEQSSSIPRRQYVEMFKSRFSANDNKEFYRKNFPPFPLRANMQYPEGIRALDPIRDEVVVSLCSIPSRQETLIKTVRCLFNQVDKIYIYLDKYETIPSELKNQNKIKIFRSQDHIIDYRDNAKFLIFNKLKTIGKPFYYFTADDDIEYPQDYVHSMINGIERYERKAVLGVHGVVLEEEPSAYFKRRFTYHFSSNTIRNDMLVNNLGTGTVGFHSEVIDSINPDSWKLGGMVDILFSIECKKRAIPMICIRRHAGWMVEFEQAKSTPNLFSEFNIKEEKILLELMSVTPWGYQGIIGILENQTKELQAKLKALMPNFSREISIKNSFSRLR
ncbi:MAG: glycosyltransferase family 2 protein [Thermomonas sp.]|uniref:glycosyltransferase family 2 protein n=1 Tax=Thermomonas sp. TaxID=1971895 RepID=UPI001EB9D2CA|nr:glycosyltransferase family A protein [Thermomonas sp.]MBV2208072.1 glycosyltransferase family 2 protein [Thermomonas sp.]